MDNVVTIEEKSNPPIVPQQSLYGTISAGLAPGKV
jgi:hypothetical protein